MRFALFVAFAVIFPVVAFAANAPSGPKSSCLAGTNLVRKADAAGTASDYDAEFTLYRKAVEAFELCASKSQDDDVQELGAQLGIAAHFQSAYDNENAIGAYTKASMLFLELCDKHLDSYAAFHLPFEYLTYRDLAIGRLSLAPIEECERRYPRPFPSPSGS
jgi:hypothetical protein